MLTLAEAEIRAVTGRNALRHVELAGAPPFAAKGAKSLRIGGKVAANSCRFYRSGGMKEPSLATSCSRCSADPGAARPCGRRP